VGCLLVLLALITPRLVIILLALFTEHLKTAYDSALWPILGFFFMPFTTLAYTWARIAGGGVHGPFWIAVIVVAVLLDIGAIRQGSRQRASNA
jgi:hypothetical protein